MVSLCFAVYGIPNMVQGHYGNITVPFRQPKIPLQMYSSKEVDSTLILRVRSARLQEGFAAFVVMKEGSFT
jgi:hypothetical protein